jgi:uncharacterized membrane protein
MDQPTRAIPLAPSSGRMAVNAARGGAFLERHWLVGINTLIGVYVGLATAAPLLRASDHEAPAGAIYGFFGFLCHQRADRSFFLGGEQIAVCERCLAMYSAFFLAGLLFAVVRGWLRPLSMRMLAALSTPVAVDGLTQLGGLRESVWELRVVTGALFAIGIAWLVLPHLQASVGVRVPDGDA